MYRLSSIYGRGWASYLVSFPFITTGLTSEGLFRVNGNLKTVEHLRAKYENGETVDLPAEGDVSSAASLLKLFLRELPDGVITSALHPKFIQLYQGDWVTLPLLTSIHISLHMFHAHLGKGCELSGTAPAWYAEGSRLSPKHLQLKGSSGRWCERPLLESIKSCWVVSTDFDDLMVRFSIWQLHLFKCVPCQNIHSDPTDDA